MSPVYSLEPLVVGVFPAFPLDRFLHGAEPGTTLAAPCLAWLARGSDGSTILVDTGPPAPTARTAGLHQELQVNAEHRIDAALRARGVDPAEVGTVILTHLHFDHSAHLDLLPRARFLVQRAEIQYAAAPADEHRRGYEVGYDGVIPHWTRAFDRIDRIDGDHEVAPGCTVLALPGHTPGSQGAVFDTAHGRRAVAGDLVNVVENWRGSGPGGHVAPALHSDLDACYQSFARLERAADDVLASHDFRMINGYGAT